MIPAIVTQGQISVTNASATAAGTGTAWSTQLDRGALIFVGSEPKPGIVASRRVRSTDADPESQPAGTFVEDDGFDFVDPWHGATSAQPEDYVAVVFGGHADLTETLIAFLTGLSSLGLIGSGSGSPSPTEGREGQAYIDLANGVFYLRKAGVWQQVNLVGIFGDGKGPWVGDPETKTALSIAGSPAQVAIDFDTGALPVNGASVIRHFSLTINAACEIQLPTNAEVGDVFDVLFQMSGGPHAITYVDGYTVEGGGNPEDLIQTADGAFTRLRHTVDAVGGSPAEATDITVEEVAFAKGEVVEHLANIFLSNIDDNTVEPKVVSGDIGVSTDEWTWLATATVAGVLAELGIPSITISESDPSGGSEGALWIKVPSS